MFGRIFSVFLSSLSESYKLEERYRQTTTRLGWITVAISCLGLLAIMYVTRLMFGIPLEGGPIEGMRLKLIAWIVLTIVLVPIAFYAGMVFVYGAYGSLMLILGRFTWQQAVDFACRAKYPEQWYKSNA
jgi:hypothetical protein